MPNLTGTRNSLENRERMPSHTPRVIRIVCRDTGSTADILPDRGAACASAMLMHDGVPRPVVWAPPGYGANDSPMFSGGIPILCPFPGRLASGAFEFRGRRITPPAGPGGGAPIHGLVHDRPWRVIDRSVDRVGLEFQLSREAAKLGAAWPADFRLTATWSVAAAALALDLRLEPLGPMPAALGVHPYFPLPVVPGGDRRECLLDVPARSWQPLERGLACGGPVPAATRLAFPGVVWVADQQLDDAFVDLAATGDRVCARLVDPSGAAIVMRFDPVFTACVIYTPPHREALCIEPWTVVPGAPPFSPALGWRMLEAGEPLAAGLTISVE